MRSSIGPILLVLASCLFTGCHVASKRHAAPPPPQRPIASGHFEEFERYPPAKAAEADRLRQQERWDLWADANLRTGDVVFRRESWRVVGGAWDVTKFISKLADSNFSHVGFVAVEDGRAYVYDTTRVVGPRRVRFHEFLFAGEMNFGIKRPKPEHEAAIPDAYDYVRRVHAERVPFDPDFDEGPETIYCTELVELAYRSAGVPLSRRTAYVDFPRWKEFPTQTRIAAAATGWSEEHAVYAPGNADFGLWGSEALELVIVGRNPYDPEVTSALPPLADNEPRGFARYEEPRPKTGPGESYLRFGR